MIKANELRIGNYIYVSDLLILTDRSVGKCNYHHISDIEKGDEEWLYEPIPLTEEWLLKFGFRWNKELNVYESPEYLGYQVWGVGKGVNIDFQNWEAYNIITKSVVNKKIKYVHQLQNLYFALTNEELTLKD